MQRLRGFVQHYAWGDTEFIPELLGLRPDGRPWAELWLGTHPNGPTRLAADDRPLAEIAGELPYMLKVLSAAQPLSLQTHPNAEQAISGFSRGVYADDKPKPELLMALTEFTALCGLRPAAATIELLERIEDERLEHLAALVDSNGPAAAVEGLYRGTIAPRPIIDACCGDDSIEAVWVGRLDAMYPGEPSVAASLLLNLVTLQPGQALRLDAGNLHAYLHGSGIELMGASDNVIRGGLTIKPVDIDELLNVIDSHPLAEPVLAPVNGRFDLPAAGVGLQFVAAGDTHRTRGDEIALGLDGVSAWYISGEEFTAEVDTYIVVPVATNESARRSHDETRQADVQPMPLGGITTIGERTK